MNRRSILRIFTSGQSIADVAILSGASTATVVKVLRRDLKVAVIIPKRSYKRRVTGPTVRQQLALAAAHELRTRRAAGEDISVAQIARAHDLDRDGVGRALRQLNRDAPLDDSGFVTDTNSERRRT